MDASKKYCEPTDFKITNITAPFREMIKSRACSNDVPMMKIVRDVIPEILSEYPEDMKILKDGVTSLSGDYLKIRFIDPKKLAQLKNIAANLDVSLSDFMKVKLFDKSQKIPYNPNLIRD